MPARFWPLVAYAALGVVALARGGGAEREAAIPGLGPGEGRGTARRAVEGAGAGRSPREERRKTTSSHTDRGRAADAPWNIPWDGWKDILRRVTDRMNADHLLTVAAGVVYFCLLALFPALAALVSLYGLVADASTIDATVSSLSGILPGGAIQILHDALQRLVAKSGAGLSVSFVAGLVVALWSANSGVKAIIDALNAVYDEEETRGFVRLNLVSLAFTLAGIVSLAVAVAVVVAAPIALGVLGLGGVADALIGILRWPAIVVLVVLGLGVLYAYAPSRRAPRWRWISVGAVSAAVVWLMGSLLFSWTIANFGAYDATYGSLGAGVGMMVWMWISMIVVLLGAQLDAEIERARGSSGGDPAAAAGQADRKVDMAMRSRGTPVSCYAKSRTGKKIR